MITQKKSLKTIFYYFNIQYLIYFDNFQGSVTEWRILIGHLYIDFYDNALKDVICEQPQNFVVELGMT